MLMLYIFGKAKETHKNHKNSAYSGCCFVVVIVAVGI